MVRYFASHGKRRPLRWRWRCTSAGFSPGTNGPGRSPTKSAARKRRAIPTPARPTTGTGSRRWNGWLPRRASPPRKSCIVTAMPGTTLPTARRTADRTEAGRFSVILKPHHRSRHPHAASDLLNPRCMMTPSRDISRLLEIMAALRTPGTGCPWDLEQDFATIAPYTIEEAYEVADAI